MSKLLDMSHLWVIFFVLAIGLATSAVFAENECAQTMDPTTIVDRIERSPDGLPRTYGDLVPHPEPVRKEIFQRSSPELRSVFWREHLRLFLSLELSRDQERSLRALIDAAEPQAFDSAMPDSEARRELDQSVEELAAVFPREILRDMVATLGPPTTERRGGEEPPRSPCSCNLRQDWCDGITYCADLDCEIDEGCGNFWLAECNGQCCHPWFQDCSD